MCCGMDEANVLIGWNSQFFERQGWKETNSWVGFTDLCKWVNHQQSTGARE